MYLENKTKSICPVNKAQVHTTVKLLSCMRLAPSLLRAEWEKHMKTLDPQFWRKVGNSGNQVNRKTKEKALVKERQTEKIWVTLISFLFWKLVILFSWERLRIFWTLKITLTNNIALNHFNSFIFHHLCLKVNQLFWAPLPSRALTHMILPSRSLKRSSCLWWSPSKTYCPAPSMQDPELHDLMKNVAKLYTYEYH